MSRGCRAVLVYASVGSENVECECGLPRGHDGPHEFPGDGYAPDSGPEASSHQGAALTFEQRGQFILRWPAILARTEVPGFVECDACRVKPGCPALCADCLGRRRAYDAAVATMPQKVREKLGRALADGAAVEQVRRQVASATEAPTHCAIHLRENARCPAPALYVVLWSPQSSGDEQMLRRPVCAHHLVRAIEEALDQQRRGLETVRVGLI